MILAQHLDKHYGDLTALHDVSFDAKEGEVLGILGLNGAGKSTLLRIIAGDLSPCSGEVLVHGERVSSTRAHLRGRVGYLPQGSPLYEEMSVREHLKFLLRLHGYRRPQLRDRIAAVAEATHIGHVLDRLVGELSMGFRKRVGIAAAILHEPPVVILDEPITGLDPAEIVGMRELVCSLGRTHTVLVSSHILSEVTETCDRLLVLHEGRLVDQGTEGALRERLAGGLRLSLVLRGDEEALRAHLDTTPDLGHLTHCEQTISRAEGPLLSITITMQEDERERLVKSLAHAGFGIRALTDERTGLEALFLAVIEREGTP